MNSCIYQGQVWHRRLTPRHHEFQYRLYMLYLDLAELPALFDAYWLWSARGLNLAWFRASDHYSEGQAPLDTAIRNLVLAHCGRRPDGPIRLLTQLRCFGYYMNPVCFYYCWDRSDHSVEFIVAEVSNTPWGERHWYVLQAASDTLQFNSPKAFHVSPFMPMQQDYRWRFNPPGEMLSVNIENYQDDVRIFQAGLQLQSQQINSVNLRRVLLSHPFMTGKIVAAIYWQALRLWLKRTPVFDHPGPYSGANPAIISHSDTQKRSSIQ